MKRLAGRNARHIDVNFATHNAWESECSGNGKVQPGSHVERIGVFDVQHAPSLIGLGLGRRVDKERTHSDDSAGGTDAIHCFNIASEFGNVGVGHHTARVRFGKNTEWTVVSA